MYIIMRLSLIGLLLTMLIGCSSLVLLPGCAGNREVQRADEFLESFGRFLYFRGFQDGSESCAGDLFHDPSKPVQKESYN